MLSTGTHASLLWTASYKSQNCWRIKLPLKSHVFFKPFRIDAIKQGEIFGYCWKVWTEAEDFPALRSYDNYAAVEGHVPIFSSNSYKHYVKDLDIVFSPLFQRERRFFSDYYSRRRRLIKQLVFLLHQGEWENGSSAPGSAIKNSSYSLTRGGNQALIWD